MEKHPIYAEGFAHIQKISENYKLLNAVYNNISICSSELFDDHIKFEYIKGQTLNERLLKLTDSYDKISFLAELSEITEKMYSSKTKTPFNYSDEFESVFGTEYKQLLSSCNLESFLHSNIDTNFDNIIVSDEDNSWYMVDYEWVFSFPIPIRFIQFRSLLYFYTTNSMMLQEFILFDEILKHFGFTKVEVEVYSDMDNNFIRFISDKGNLFDNYAKKSVNLDLQAELLKVGNIYYSQLYIVNAEGMIDEKVSIIKNVMLSGKPNEDIILMYEGLDLSEIRAFRFDPLNQSCFIKINKIYCVFDDKKYPIPYTQMNAYLSEESGMVFISDDPQIYLDLDKIKTTTLKEEGEFTLVIDYTIIDIEISERHKYFPLMKSYNEIYASKLISDEKSSNYSQEVISLQNEKVILEASLLQGQQKINSCLEVEKKYLSELDLKEMDIKELKETIESMKFKNKIKKWIGR
ncbi:hypothetical protein QNH28_27125 [Paenibacillus sp. G2S3]|uniref:hypothetical protein n=1 Tax=Paenibacillus sp. G2S3 TaxID=3047872 RepID=UPI0024C127D0|nr:hypothetical protein [Paenibacillus sp. G2S3]WHY19023.1 hypothetical protein QNH28_27125 [Paenibacillus sp. G2S3]